MKKWVELDRDSLDLGDVGKRVRVFQQEFKVTDILNNGQEVELIDPAGEFLSLSNDMWVGTEIEEEIPLTSPSQEARITILENLMVGGHLTLPEGMVFNKFPDPLAYPEWVTTPSHDCYLDGHDIVDTGTLLSECRHCHEAAEWDRQSCSWVLKTSNN